MTTAAASRYDGSQVVYRAYYRGNHRWRGYSGSAVPGVSYGLCRPLRSDAHFHHTQKQAIECARRTAARVPGSLSVSDVRIPACGAEPKFHVGQRVRVVAIYDTSTDAGLLGFEGTVREVESLPPGVVPPTQHNYDVDGRYLNEQMLEKAPAG